MESVVKCDMMKLKTNQELLNLTNDFLENFFNIASKLENRERPGNDSYSFNYILMAALGQSDYVKDVQQKDPGYPMPSAGTNLIEDLYSSNLSQVPENLLYVIEHFDDQLHDDNEFTDLKKTKSRIEFTVKSQNVKFQCIVTLSEDGRFKNLVLKDKREVFHKLETSYLLGESINSPSDLQKTLYFPDKLWLSRIKDINEFYSVLDCVYNEIKEEAEAEY